MARLPGNPIRYIPTGACDALDGTNAPAGAMRALQNLIPDPSTRGLWSPRPAATLLIPFDVIVNPGEASGMVQVGNILYGTIPSATFTGHDEPFAVDLVTGTFLPISGATSGNTPVSLASSGDWTPPILAQVASRVIVCHPGFPGGDTKFGWFDVSGAKIGASGDTAMDRYIRGNPNIFGVQPGLIATGSGIAANSTVEFASPGWWGFDFAGDSHSSTTIDGIASTANLVPGLSLAGPGVVSGTTILARHANSIDISEATLTTAAAGTFSVLGTPSVLFGDTHSNMTIDALNYPNGIDTMTLQVGMGISGAGILPGTTITAVAGASITISQPAFLSNPQIALTAVGNVIRLSANTTATAGSVAVTLTGGSRAAPLWGAGDTIRNPLPSVPLGVAQFNGRAYFACGTDGIPWSDSLLPCVRSNANQALTTSDGLAVTAVAPLLLSAPITGGIVQAIIAFQGINCMRQITGDAATNNLSMNLLPVATGTLAPLSIAPTEKGLAFVSPDGLRFIDFSANVSNPIGDFGQGVVVPFQNALYPSRICAAAASSVLRITVQNGGVDGNPFQEWWYDLSLQAWSGPHTFPAALIQRWGSTSVVMAVGIPGKLWLSSVTPGPADTYVENGQVLSCIAETALLPDNAEVAMNQMIEANLACSGVRQINYEVLDEGGATLDYVGIPIEAGNDGAFRQRPVEFHQPIVFKQMRVVVTGQADRALRLGNFYWRWRRLGYNLQPPVTPPNLLGRGATLIDAAGNPIVLASGGNSGAGQRNQFILDSSLLDGADVL